MRMLPHTHNPARTARTSPVQRTIAGSATARRARATRVPAMVAAVGLLGIVLGGAPLYAQSSAIIYGELADPQTLDPYLNDDLVSQRLVNLMYDSLLSINENLAIVPGLAERWERATDAAGRTTYRFFLRPNVFWHDGVQFTAADVVATWRTVMNPRTPTNEKSRFFGVESMSAINDSTLLVVFSGEIAAGLGNMSFKVLPAHHLPDFALTPTHRLVRNPVGTGPFRFDRWVEGQFVSLVANRRFHIPGVPAVDRVVMQVFSNQNTLLTALETRAIDLVFDIPPEQIPRFQANARLRLEDYYAQSYDFVAFNLNVAPLSDAEFRRALVLATDRRTMVSTLFQGRARLISGPFPANSWAYNSAVLPTPHDLAEARAILDRLGYIDTNGDGIREFRRRPIRFSLLALRGDDGVLQRSLAIQQNFRQLGIELDIEFVPLRLLSQRVFDDRDFDMFTGGWNVGVDPDPYSIWFSAEIASGLNAISYFNQRVDDLILQARRTSDRATRQQLYQALHAVVAEDHPYLFLWTRERTLVINADVQGFVLDPFSLTEGLKAAQRSGR